jgi:hypothetical protein
MSDEAERSWRQFDAINIQFSETEETARGLCAEIDQIHAAIRNQCVKQNTQKCID